MPGISHILAPVMLALRLVIAVHPLRRRLTRLPSWLSTTVLVVVVYGVLIALALVLVASTARFANLLRGYADHAAGLGRQLAALLERLGGGNYVADTVAGSFDLGRLLGFVEFLVGGALARPSNLFFLLALLLFLGLAPSPNSRSSRVASG